MMTNKQQMVTQNGSDTSSVQSVSGISELQMDVSWSGEMS